MFRDFLPRLVSAFFRDDSIVSSISLSTWTLLVLSAFSATYGMIADQEFQVFYRLQVIRFEDGWLGSRVGDQVLGRRQPNLGVGVRNEADELRKNMSEQVSLH